MKSPNTKIESFCRERRSFSVSPTVSFDNSQCIPLTEEEKKEKNYYGAVIKDMTKELFMSFDDIIKHVNYTLVSHLRTILKVSMTEEEREDIIQRFLDVTFKEFTLMYDKGEYNFRKFFKLDTMDKDIAEFVARGGNEKKEEVSKVIEEEFEKAKKKFFEEYRRMIKLTLEIQIQKEIYEYSNKKEDDKNKINISDSLEMIKKSFNDKPDFTVLEHNLKYINEQYDQMNQFIDEQLDK